MMAQCKAGILFGGASSEHEVSLKSAAAVVRSFPAGYGPVLIGITRDGRWFRFSGSADEIESGAWERSGSLCPAFVSPDRAVHGLVILRPDGRYETERLDAVFPVLHGRNGEDGTIQGLFELAGIPYVGCGVLASAICMDKAVTNAMLDHFGIPHAPWVMTTKYELSAFEHNAQVWESRLGYPMFVKPANAGSSVGISKVHSRDALRRALDLAFAHDPKAVIEKCIVGKELECSVLGNRDPQVSAVGEILPANEFYDYDAKYNNAASETRIPAAISDDKRDEMRALAARAYRVLGCRGLARVDFLLEESTGRLYLNEPNTIPGFTSISMYAKMWAAAGVGFAELIDRLFKLAAERD